MFQKGLSNNYNSKASKCRASAVETSNIPANIWHLTSSNVNLLQHCCGACFGMGASPCSIHGWTESRASDLRFEEHLLGSDIHVPANLHVGHVGCSVGCGVLWSPKKMQEGHQIVLPEHFHKLARGYWPEAQIMFIQSWVQIAMLSGNHIIQQARDIGYAGGSHLSQMMGLR